MFSSLKTDPSAKIEPICFVAKWLQIQGNYELRLNGNFNPTTNLLILDKTFSILLQPAHLTLILLCGLILIPNLEFSPPIISTHECRAMMLPTGKLDACVVKKIQSLSSLISVRKQQKGSSHFHERAVFHIALFWEMCFTHCIEAILSVMVRKKFSVLMLWLNSAYKDILFLIKGILFRGFSVSWANTRDY